MTISEGPCMHCALWSCQDRAFNFSFSFLIIHCAKGMLSVWKSLLLSVQIVWLLGGAWAFLQRLPSFSHNGNPSGEWQHSFFVWFLFIWLLLWAVLCFFELIFSCILLVISLFLLLDQHDSSDRIHLPSCRIHFQIVNMTWHKHLACHYVAGLCLLLTLCVCVCVCVIDECDKRSVYSVFHIIICCIMLSDGEGCDLVSVTFVMPSCVCVCVCVCVLQLMMKKWLRCVIDAHQIIFHCTELTYLLVYCRIWVPHKEDCFGSPEVIWKVGIDIRDNKCSWLVVQALKLATDKQRKVLEDNYGQHDVKKVAKVKKLFAELDLDKRRAFLC